MSLVCLQLCYMFQEEWCMMTIIKIHMPRVGYFIYSKSSKHPRMRWKRKRTKAQNCVQNFPSSFHLFFCHFPIRGVFILDFPSSISRKRARKVYIYFSFFFFFFLIQHHSIEHIAKRKFIYFVLAIHILLVFIVFLP